MADRRLLATLARQAGLDLLAVVSTARLAGTPDLAFFHSWLEKGFHAGLAYLTGERARIRGDLERLLPGVRSIVCLAVNYNTAFPYSTRLDDNTRAWISRYAWGDDYHQVLKGRLEQFISLLRNRLSADFQARPCVDTSPLLERTMARHAGVGWTGKNTCLINQRLGSWLFLGEVLTTLEFQADEPAPDRCGTCTRCIDACPTSAIPEPYVLDSRRCISYWTVEARGSISPEIRAGIGRHVFGCDICQDVCPWNRKAAVTTDPAFQSRPGLFNPPLERLARITENEFREMFRHSAVRRARYRGFLRNVCVAMGNSRDPGFIPELARLAEHPDEIIREHAQWALDQLKTKSREPGADRDTHEGAHV